MGTSESDATRRIVVGVDGSPASRLALRRAVEISASTGIRVDAVYAWQVSRSVGLLVEAGWTAGENAAELMLSEIADEVLGEDKPVSLALLTEQGSATRVLLGHSQSATLLVVGSRGRGGLASVLLGSVSRHCAEGSACPVLVIHVGSPEVEPHDLAVSSIDRVVVGVDGSESSELALRWAARIGSFASARVEAVIAWTFPTSVAPVFSKDWRPDRDAQLTLTTAVEKVFGALGSGNVDLGVDEGDAARALVERSRHADLLVVGSRGHGGFAELLLGSVSMACAEHAHCPVLIVRGDHVPGRAQDAGVADLAQTST